MHLTPTLDALHHDRVQHEGAHGIVGNEVPGRLEGDEDSDDRAARTLGEVPPHALNAGVVH